MQSWNVRFNERSPTSRCDEEAAATEMLSLTGQTAAVCVCICAKFSYHSELITRGNQSRRKVNTWFARASRWPNFYGTTFARIYRGKGMFSSQSFIRVIRGRWILMTSLYRVFMLRWFHSKSFIRPDLDKVNWSTLRYDKGLLGGWC